MAIGLQNAPGLFQKMIEAVLSTGKWPFALLYDDNVFAFLRPLAKQIYQVQHVPFLSNNAKVTFELKKWELFTRNIDYFEHIKHSQ